MHAAAMNWTNVWTGKPLDPDDRTLTAIGAGVTGPLEAAARKAGVESCCEHRMTAIYRQEPASGRVLGIAVETTARSSTSARARR